MGISRIDTWPQGFGRNQPPVGAADALGAEAGPRPASRHWGLVSSDSLSSCANAALHMATALEPHACRRAPPVELAALTVTQPSCDRPYPPGLTAAHTPSPANTASKTPPTIAIPRLSLRVSASALGCCVFRYTTAAYVSRSFSIAASLHGLQS